MIMKDRKKEKAVGKRYKGLIFGEHGRASEDREEGDALLRRRLWCPNDHQDEMSRIVRKPAFCICENKDADQLRGNREADQRLCFRYTDSTIPLLPKS